MLPVEPKHPVPRPGALRPITKHAIACHTALLVLSFISDSKSKMHVATDVDKMAEIGSLVENTGVVD